MNAVVEARNLTKGYGDVIAVDQVSFTLAAGNIYGLLGRNGAGKTTIMRILTAQEECSSRSTFSHRMPRKRTTR